MLPGFRFLFAAIVLSMSILIFGLGAAALLRAAHEEFASAPPWHATPETVFAQQAEAAKPVLALLRVEPSVAEPPASDNVAVIMPSPEQAAAASTPVEPERIARSEDSTLPEVAKPSPEVAKSATDATKSEIPLPAGPPLEATVQSEAPAVAETNAPASVAETKVAAIADVSPPVTEAAAATPDQTVAPTPGDTEAATKIATLGGPAVAIDGETPAQPVVNYFIRRQRHVRRPTPHHRIAHARAARAAPAADAFSQPGFGPRR
jgi:hypothetical protein